MIYRKGSRTAAFFFTRGFTRPEKDWGILNMIEQQFNQVYAIMTASFPESERRTYAGQKELLSNP
ncbi:hypothetical protein NYE69_24090 [Paenibacillus sp. FSL R5-0527]|uniref:hypothetical protein n=1 Tax=Paenibacillus sp. FSL R5-0527 TaxID=2975321 RepID=UPI00097B8BFB|nr:hypothetical protein BK140_03740 [Paenibacillus macerans]